MEAALHILFILDMQIGIRVLEFEVVMMDSGTLIFVSAKDCILRKGTSIVNEKCSTVRMTVKMLKYSQTDCTGIYNRGFREDHPDKMHQNRWRWL